MKLRLTSTTESSNLQNHHQNHQMLSIISHLEYEIVTQPTLIKHISDEYQSMALLYVEFSDIDKLK